MYGLPHRISNHHSTEDVNFVSIQRFWWVYKLFYKILKLLVGQKGIHILALMDMPVPRRKFSKITALLSA